MRGCGFGEAGEDVGGGLLADAVGIQAVYLTGGRLLLAAAAVGAAGARAATRTGFGQ